jgi:hypothetical protein
LGPASTSQIKTFVNRRGQTVWTHLIKLERNGKVVRVGTTDNGSIVWALSKNKRKKISSPSPEKEEFKPSKCDLGNLKPFLQRLKCW